MVNSDGANDTGTVMKKSKKKREDFDQNVNLLAYSSCVHASESCGILQQSFTQNTADKSSFKKKEKDNLRTSSQYEITYAQLSTPCKSSTSKSYVL